MAKSKDKLEVERFFSSFMKKEFAPCYFFCGDETLLIEEVIDSLVEHAVEPATKEFNFDLIHGNETDGRKIVSLASSYPMMADRRVVIIKDFDRVNDMEALETYVENPSSTTVLVLVSNNPDFRKKPYSVFKKLGIVHGSYALRDHETIAWIEARFKKRKRSIEPAAVQLLFSYVGNSLRELANEIEKLLLTAEENSTVGVKDVEHVVGMTREFTPFELANKVAEKNISQAIKIAESLIKSGENAVGLIAVLTLHFIKLWKLQDGVRQGKPEGELAQIASTHPYFLKSYLSQAKNYPPHEIENIFLLLTEADLSAKSSADPKLILTKTIAEIISGTVSQTQEALTA